MKDDEALVRRSVTYPRFVGPTPETAAAFDRILARLTAAERVVEVAKKAADVMAELGKMDAEGRPADMDIMRKAMLEFFLAADSYDASTK